MNQCGTALRNKFRSDGELGDNAMTNSARSGNVIDVLEQNQRDTLIRGMLL